LACGLLTGLGCQACAGSDPAAKPESFLGDWQEAVALEGHGSYVPAYYLPPGVTENIQLEDGAGVWVQLSVLLGVAGDTCPESTARGNRFAYTPETFWSLRMPLSQALPGKYRIVLETERPPAPGDEFTASAHLERWHAGERIDVETAVAGEVTIDSIASTARDWQHPARLTGSAVLEFPVESPETGFCYRSLGLSATEPERHFCECHSDSGASFECEVTADNPHCCIDQQARRVTVQIALDAQPCAHGCLSTPGLAARCQRIRDPNAHGNSEAN